MSLEITHNGAPLDDSQRQLRNNNPIYRSICWDYLPMFFCSEDDPNSLILFKQLLSELEPLVVGVRMNDDGTSYKSPRESCVFARIDGGSGSSGNDGVDRKFYQGLPVLDWNVSPTLLSIRLLIEDEIELLKPFDYCLAHIYRDGKSNISWHSDREALNSEIASVSLGQSRKFRFRRIGSGTAGWETEIRLRSGDLVFMKKGCQTTYQHMVPKETTVTGCRINLTFRQFNDSTTITKN